jgi:hypothetical protein
MSVGDTLTLHVRFYRVKKAITGTISTTACASTLPVIPVDFYCLTVL